ncbi:MAG: glycoside hydrolase family 76 protein, partial [bacterium]
MLKKIFLFLLILFIFITPSHSEFLYQEHFDRLFQYLIKNHWNESGDWGGDMMGDASWFATVLLFEMGARENKPEYTKKAIKTAEWQLSLFRSADTELNKIEKTPNAVSLLGGFPGIFYAYKYTKRKDFKSTLDQIFLLGCSIIKSDPGKIVETFGVDAVVFLAGVSFAAYSYYEETGALHLKKCSLEAIDKANKDYWHEDEKHYGTLWDWSAGAMLLALSGAYRLTKDEFYLERANTLIDTVMKRLWDEESGGLISRHFHLKKAKVLSGNNLFVTAMIEWYKVVPDEKYLNYAEKTLNFIFSPTLYDGTYPHHHWTKEEGRDESYCTGCHFHTLLN